MHYILKNESNRDACFRWRKFGSADSANGVLESGKPAAKSGGVKFLRKEENAVVHAVGS